MYTSENKEEKQFAENLFAYFILKDGLQFRQYNISKIFPTIMFREVSKVLDTFEDTIAKISPKEKEDLLSKFKSLWFADIRNKKHRIKLKGSDESKVFSAYRIKDKQKTKIFSKDFVINQPPLYLQIEKNGEKNEYTKVGIDSINIQGGVKPKLPQYVDYLGASYRKFYTTSKIKLQFQTKKGLKEYSYRIEEEVNQQDENLRVFNLTGKNKEFKLVVQITNVIGNVNSYNAQLFENEQFVENVKIDYKELQNIERFSYKNQPVVYIREPYYGSTITDLTVDAGLIPAVSEVNAKQGVSKLQDLVNQLKEENQKLGYIQFYENLLSKRYSPNFDKSFKEETISKMESKGEEISSYSDNLAFALTNPTHTSPQGSEWKRNWTESQNKWRNYLSKGIEFEGKVYKDVEEAYQKNKSKYSKTKDLFNKETTDDLMVKLLTIKLETYPKLVEGIDFKGGIEYLQNSTHQPTKQNSHWETGGDNAFIKSLIQAYKNIKEKTLEIQDKPYKAGESEKERNSINDLFDEEYTNGCDNLN